MWCKHYTTPVFGGTGEKLESHDALKCCLLPPSRGSVVSNVFIWVQGKRMTDGLTNTATKHALYILIIQLCEFCGSHSHGHAACNALYTGEEESAIQQSAASIFRIKNQSSILHSKAASSYATLVAHLRNRWRHIPEFRNFHVHCTQNLDTHILILSSQLRLVSHVMPSRQALQL